MTAIEEPEGTTERDGFSPISAYGLIGDSGTAALISRGGSVDWLCLPNVDSDPVFGALLDPERGGRWIVAPRSPVVRIEREYEPSTAVLKTRYVCPSGVVVVHDLFAAAPSPGTGAKAAPLRYLVRRIVGEAGVVDLDVVFEPRQPFGGRAFRLSASGNRGSAAVGGKSVFLSSTSPVRKAGSRLVSDISVRAGEVAHAAISYAERDLGVLPPVGEFAEDAYRKTVTYWREWHRPVPDDVPLAPLVARSLLVLKLLTFAPSGGVVAAPTTSLPEAIGAGRNWDYRYVWVRDASRSVIALTDYGHHDEARAYMTWLLNAASLTRPRIRTLYDVYGRPRARERDITGLRGYRDSRPVRRGNAAVEQLQLDNWGYLVEAVHKYAGAGGRVDASMWAATRAYVDHIAGTWMQPDHGIWEVRTAPRHYVHSKVMAWVALDRGLRLAREQHLPADRPRWQEQRRVLSEAILTEGYDAGRGTFVSVFGGDGIDAALLEIAGSGIVDPDDERLRRTIDRIRSELAVGPLVYRYRADDGLAGTEGAFVPCSFWLVEALARTGRRDEALEVFQGAAAVANDVGLLPEEVDAESGEALGNFPQGLSHIALVKAACALRAGGQPRGR